MAVIYKKIIVIAKRLLIKKLRIIYNKITLAKALYKNNIKHISKCKKSILKTKSALFEALIFYIDNINTTKMLCNIGLV